MFLLKPNLSQLIWLGSTSGSQLRFASRGVELLDIERLERRTVLGDTNERAGLEDEHDEPVYWCGLCGVREPTKN